MRCLKFNFLINSYFGKVKRLLFFKNPQSQCFFIFIIAIIDLLNLFNSNSLSLLSSKETLNLDISSFFIGVSNPAESKRIYFLLLLSFKPGYLILIPFVLILVPDGSLILDNFDKT